MITNEIADSALSAIYGSLRIQRREYNIRPPSKSLIGKRFDSAKIREDRMKYSVNSFTKKEYTNIATTAQIIFATGPPKHNNISFL